MPQFAETCASALIATVVGPHVVVSDQKGDLHPNVFGLIVGGSGISDKTVTLEIVEQILLLVGEKLKQNLLLPNKFSIEGMQKHLVTETNEGAIIGDEYTSMHQSTGKTWLKDTMEFLSKLYDGRLPKYTTISRGTEYVPRVFVSFLSATTFYICKLMKDDDFFLQGTGCRFLWDVDLNRNNGKMTGLEAASFFINDPSGKEKRDAELEKIANKLVSLYKYTEKASEMSRSGVLILGLSMVAMRILGEFMIKQREDAEYLFNRDVLNPDVGYITRQIENGIKLSAIHCLGRYYDDIGTLDPPEISKEDVDWAIAKVRYHYDMYSKLREIRDSIILDNPTRGHKSDMRRVLDLIERHGGYVNISKIMQSMGWKSDDALSILQIMVQTELIEPHKVKPRGSKEHTVYTKKGEIVRWVVENEVKEE
jgi:hypothetical protein